MKRLHLKPNQQADCKRAEARLHKVASTAKTLFTQPYNNPSLRLFVESKRYSLI